MDTMPRIDLHLDFASVISDMGMTPIDVATARGSKAPSEMFKKHCPAFANEESVQLITWTFFGNDKPVVHCYFEIPTSICIIEPVSSVTVGTKNIHAINTYYDLAGQDITHYINTLNASINDEVNALFELPMHSPLINFQQSCFNIQDIAFAYTDIYFNPNVVSLKYVLQYESFYRKGRVGSDKSWIVRGV
jgi:DNA-binding GntR family transcriptional regulator